MKVFIDSSIPMYVAGKKHPNREASRRFLAQVQDGKIQGCTSTEVLQEILYRYSALRRLDLAGDVYNLFVEICPEVFDVTLADTDSARDLLLSGAAVSTRDAVHAAIMRNHSVQWIATFDGGFDEIPGVRRWELV